ncbi:MAG: PilN domain-containing protein [Planctomycetaceae bacterium]
MKTHHNLLPPEFQKRLLFAVRIRQWCKIWAVTALVLTAFGVQKYVGTFRLQEQWNALNQQAIPVVDAKLRNAAREKQLAELRDKIALIDGVNDAKDHLSLIGVISQSVRNSGDSIQVQSCTFHELATSATKPVQVAPIPNPPAAPVVTVVEKTMKIDLRGLSTDERAIARFINTLKKNEAFTHVELKAVRGIEVSNQSLRAYQIECDL